MSVIISLVIVLMDSYVLVPIMESAGVESVHAIQIGIHRVFIIVWSWLKF